VGNWDLEDTIAWSYRGKRYTAPMFAGTDDTVFVRRINGLIVICNYNRRIGYIAVDIHLPDVEGLRGCLESRLVNYWEFHEYENLNEEISSETACLRLARYLIANEVGI